MSEDEKTIMDVLKESFPGRSDEQLVPFGLLYAGMRWGRDSRFAEVPLDAEGQPMYGGDTGQAYNIYLRWLAEYLSTLEATPNAGQKGLCDHLDGLFPEDGTMLVGMNAALYAGDVAFVEQMIADGLTSDEALARMAGEVAGSEAMEELPEQEHFEEMYRTIQEELAEIEKFGPKLEFSDYSWRVPLSLVVKRVETQNERMSLLHHFFETYNQYVGR